MNRKQHTHEKYDKKAKDYNQVRGVNPEIVNKLKKLIKRGKILSLGCGSGCYEEELNKKYNFEVVGLDNSKEMIRLTKGRGIEAVLTSMVDLNMFEDESFDGVYEIRAIHHVAGNFRASDKERKKLRQQTINEAYRVLRKGGMFVSVNSDPIQNKALWFWYYFPEAIQRKVIIQIKIKDLIKWMKNAGFKDIGTERMKDDVVPNMVDPRILLGKKVRNSISDFSYLTQKELRKGLRKLKKEIESGKAVKTVEFYRKKMNKLGGAVAITYGKK